MRKLVVFTFFLFFLLWLLLAGYLVGYFSIDFLPEKIRLLRLPKSTTELGDSLAILDGLFTSIAIVLGLIAVLLQGRELKESTRAQTEQVYALTAQIREQQASNLLGAYAARLQFLLTEAERLEYQIDKLIVKVEVEKDKEKKNEQWAIIKNCRKLQGRYRNQAKEIDKKIESLLEASWQELRSG